MGDRDGIKGEKGNKEGKVSFISLHAHIVYLNANRHRKVSGTPNRTRAKAHIGVAVERLLCGSGNRPTALPHQGGRKERGFLVGSGR